MSNLNEKTVLGKNANQLAAEEGKFNSRSVLEELEPLFREYFIGGFELCGEEIKLFFKNGQKFSLTVKEIE